MHEVWMALGIMIHKAEHLPILRHEAYMRWATLVPEKNGMESLMRALNEAEIKEEIIPVHMNQGKTSKKHMKYKGETPTVMVYEGQINKIKTLPVPTEE